MDTLDLIDGTWMDDDGIHADGQSETPDDRWWAWQDARAAWWTAHNHAVDLQAVASAARADAWLALRAMVAAEARVGL